MFIYIIINIQHYIQNVSSTSQRERERERERERGGCVREGPSVSRISSHPSVRGLSTPCSLTACQNA